MHLHPPHHIGTGGKLILLCLLSGGPVFSQTSADLNTSVPIATQWLYDAVAPGAKGTIDSVVRIWCRVWRTVGSGFVLDSGYVITNHHVVQVVLPPTSKL